MTKYVVRLVDQNGFIIGTFGPYKFKSFPDTEKTLIKLIKQYFLNPAFGGFIESVD